jgi:hypothetical protein
MRPRIARKDIESSQRLDRHHWVVERIHAWFNRFRRLPIRFERRAEIYEAFTSLAASLITFNQIRALVRVLRRDSPHGSGGLTGCGPARRSYRFGNPRS